MLNPPPPGKRSGTTDELYIGKLFPTLLTLHKNSGISPLILQSLIVEGCHWLICILFSFFDLLTRP